MTLYEFDNTGHHANMWVIYCGKKHYVISANFPERLFALVPEKEDVPLDEWCWVRCENVSLIKNEILNFPAIKNMEPMTKPQQEHEQFHAAVVNLGRLLVKESRIDKVVEFLATKLESIKWRHR
ncbi:hypothetical protein KO537_22475 [Shewanella sp. NKUCC01_JLK]|uniref:hypothetical protein n=1 Tax=unclassified Shewanella TaxID=196818 RepID=UPI001567437D|nr:MULTISPECIES: hypothetical protein [unclassified Shewanella]MBW3517457.1 hypothetical protein [Shewanella sp. NKUCC01_JLK]NRD34560.1 hypothetical protein [Shewanella sp. DC2-4]